MSATASPSRELTLGLLFRRHGSFFAAGALALLFTNLLGFAIPKVIGWFIDGLGAGATARRPPGWLDRLIPLSGAQALLERAARDAPWQVALTIIGLATFAGLSRVLSRVALFHAGRLVEYELRRDLFDHLTRLPPSYFRRTPTGDLLSRAVNDLTAVRVVFGPGVLNVVNTAFVYVIGVSLLVRLDPWLALWALLPYPLVTLIARRVARGVYEHSAQVQEHLGALSQQAQETLANMQLVQLFGREDDRAEAYGRAGAHYVKANMALTRTRGLLGPLVALIGGLGLVVTLFLGGRRVIAGSMTLGQFVEFQGYLAMLAWPTLALGWVLSLWQRGRAALGRINVVLAEPESISDPPAGTAQQAPPGGFRGRVEVRGLTVGRGGAPILHEVSFEVPPGTLLGVVGRAGSGKSTLAEALGRMLEVPAGTVFLDGLDVTRLPLAAARGALAYVQQEPFLLSTSLRENLAFGALDGEPAEAAEARLREVVAQVSLTSDLAALPKGLDTQVGERGVQLSGGQRQRVALGRALLRPAPVLVLDDALSAVDAQTEAEILRALQRGVAGRTAILVSHRVAAVRGAQQIIVLDGGRIVERGTHDELVERGGLYARLYRLQHLSEELDAEEPEDLEPAASAGGAR